MKVRDIMSRRVIQIDPGETVEVAARLLTHYNIGILPVCSPDGRLQGVVTDRDLVTRCLAGNLPPGEMTVGRVMTGRVLAVQPDVEVEAAARLMGAQQVRRLPVTEAGKLCGMVSLGDVAKHTGSAFAAAEALTDISGNVSHGGFC